MDTNRPMARLGVADLEEIFQKQGDDLTILSRIKHELSFRQVPRALALQEKIRKVESNHKQRLEPQGTTSTAKPSTAPSGSSSSPTKQLDLLGTGSKKFAEPKQETLLVSQETVSFEPEPLPQLTLEDACKILKVSIGDIWEKVELARRKIVQKSSPLVTRGMPTEQAKELLSEAAFANDAAIVIAARRAGYQ